MTRFLALALLLLMPGYPALAESEPFPGVRKLMSEQEFAAAGLNKLTPAEREALDQWLIKYTAYDAPIILRTNKEVKEVEKAFELRARIKQPFTGWSGKTVFYLDNGQVWQQRQQGRHSYKGQDTEVVITRNFMGFQMMTLNATGKSIGVSRIQ